MNAKTGVPSATDQMEKGMSTLERSVENLSKIAESNAKFVMSQVKSQNES